MEDTELKNKIGELVDVFKNKKEDGKLTEEQFNKLTENLKNSLKEGVGDDLKALAEELKTQNEQNKLIQAANELVNPGSYYKLFLTDHEKTASEDEQKKIGANRFIRDVINQVNSKQSEEGAKRLLEYQKNALQVEGTDSAGGYAVPVPMANVLLDDLRSSGLFFSETTVYNMASKTLKIPTIAAAGHPTLSYVAEGAAKPISNITFGQVDLVLKKYACIIPFSDELLEDAVVDLEAFVRNHYKDWANIVFDNILFRGDGQINGIEDMTTTFVTTVGTGITTATIDNLIDVIGSLRGADLIDAKWYMSPSVWAMFHKLKSAGGGDYFLSFDEIKGRTLLGFPVVLTDSAYAVSETAAGRKFVTFGNLKKIIVGRKNEISLAKSTEATIVDGGDTRHAFQDNLTLMRIEQRVDMDSAFPTRLVQLRTAAA